MASYFSRKPSTDAQIAALSARLERQAQQILDLNLKISDHQEEIKKNFKSVDERLYNSARENHNYTQRLDEELKKRYDDLKSRLKKIETRIEGP